MNDRQPPTCGGEPMAWNVLRRQWECSCGRDVTDEFLSESAVEVRAFEHCPSAVAVAKAMINGMLFEF